MTSMYKRIADELGVKEAQVRRAADLLDEGATVPFIARYRKEVTGALDDTQLRHVDERLRYLRELEERRAVILKSIEEQGKLSDELAAALAAADTKTRLEDLYLPYKPKRRTKGQIAREAGLEPLADRLYDDPTLEPEVEAAKYLNGEGEEGAKITTTKQALEGAKYILMERFAEDAGLLGTLREYLAAHARVSARLVAGKAEAGAKFRDYFSYDEAFRTVPSHRALAIFRGRNEGCLSLSLTIGDPDNPPDEHPCEKMVAGHWGIRDRGRPADPWLTEVARWTWRIKLLPHLETDLFTELRERSEAEAINVFAANLKALLLAPPAGRHAVIGLDPGLRTGVKVAVVDATGKVLEHGAIFPNAPQRRTREAEAALLAWCRKYQVKLIAIGNGTAGRETDAFVGAVLKAHPELGIQKVMVNESGASVYSASETAAREFPNLDVTVRGAISIARRLQDPLAELVKIEPRSIGVGQYQHDVSQSRLARALEGVVEDCVNAVGVEVNTASAPLLARVSGLNPTLAGHIVRFREEHGAFATRRDLTKVQRFGAKTFEQAAGFLRIADGEDPLDASAVHPESYSVVERIAARHGRAIPALIGDSAFLRSLRPADYTDETFGLPTVTDIIAELDKPGRDPRPEFKTARFREGVESIGDLTPGMTLEGTVTNVTNFGAFVDIGVHQDGLVHVSALSHQFVKDPHDAVKAGDIVKVKVMEVDTDRKRIGLSMRLDDEPGRSGAPARARPSEGRRPSQKRASKPEKKAKRGTMAELFEEAKRNLK